MTRNLIVLTLLLYPFPGRAAERPEALAAAGDTAFQSLAQYRHAYGCGYRKIDLPCDAAVRFDPKPEPAQEAAPVAQPPVPAPVPPAAPPAPEPAPVLPDDSARRARDAAESEERERHARMVTEERNREARERARREAMENARRESMERARHESQSRPHRDDPRVRGR